MPFEHGRAVHGQQLAIAHDPNPPTVFGFIHIVGGHQGGHTLRNHFVDQVPKCAPRRRIHPAGRLIQEEQTRLVYDGGAKRHALLPSSGEVADLLSLHRLQADQIQHFRQTGLILYAIHPGVKRQVFPHRQVVI